MRTTLITTAAAGALAVGALALAAPALAAEEGEAPSSSTSRLDRIKDALTGLVTDGSLTQEQADEVAGTLADADLGGREGGPGGWGPGGHGAPGGPGLLGAGLSAAADALGLDEEELRTTLSQEGTTLADVAQAQGVGVSELVDALVATAQEHLAAAVEEGHLTQAQADERVTELRERITERVSSDLPQRLGRHGAPDGPSGEDDDAAAEEDAAAA